MTSSDVSHRQTARDLMRSQDWGVLATAMPGDGHPYASLVLVAADYDATPILLMSDLAEHAKNIAGDDRVSLLFDGTRGLSSPLTGARLSVQGRAERCNDARLRDRFLARHEDASQYVDFGDFAFYRVVVARGHLVAGFGKIEWIDRGDLLYSASEAADLNGMHEWEASANRHMNEDHSDAIQNYAQNLLNGQGDGWTMTGCDPEGCDLRRGADVLRLAFPEPCHDPDSLRRQLVALARRAAVQNPET
jgi:putative heme iron utilization protein